MPSFLYILCTLKARAKIVAKGRPSGTNTTKIMTVKFINAGNSDKTAIPGFSSTVTKIINIVSKRIKIITEAIAATLVKCLLKFFNLFCRVVLTSVDNFSSIIPLVLFFPTTQTTALQDPWVIIVPAFKNGSPPDSIELFLTFCSSPITLAFRSILSCKTIRSNELITIQSAGIFDPEASKITSPTTRSQTDTV